ncbi:DUF4862 family protein [Gilvimarinus xylanilyticus]|uniref:DUF4862 family protein n=1 Tax=Gilvimarinus xylanilyticus TaxID=2944139 RepID=A0A9X2KTY5_9GAMM|nr:DUF4862 family protein [Gilvimarinus xylanilyticus]MCP8899682.1 DUF4862 family protein [Gilvimarinus xylanilyticus]
MSYYVGAYASSPCTSGWNPELETRYYHQLKQIPSIKGLEHPFLGENLHAYDDDWFLENIDPNWQYVFTCVPGTMGAIGINPNFGIASDDTAGREQALAFMEKARAAIAKLNAHAGRQVVQAIEMQTAPNKAKASSSAASLKASLETMLQWDWQGARVVLEHCDTLIEGQEPAKGFLTLEDEIEVIKAVNQTHNANLGVVINWGRSVIETRSTTGAIEHIQQAKQAGVLAGLMFSGASDQDTPYGVWADTHMPAAPSEHSAIGAERSLMSEAQIHRCIHAADAKNLPILGIKLGIRPKDERLENRVAYNREALAMLGRT